MPPNVPWLAPVWSIHPQLFFLPFLWLVVELVALATPSILLVAAKRLVAGSTLAGSCRNKPKRFAHHLHRYVVPNTVSFNGSTSNSSNVFEAERSFSFQNNCACTYEGAAIVEVKRGGRFYRLYHLRLEQEVCKHVGDFLPDAYKAPEFVWYAFL